MSAPRVVSANVAKMIYEGLAHFNHQSIDHHLLLSRLAINNRMLAGHKSPEYKSSPKVFKGTVP